MVRKSELLKLEGYLDASNQLIKSLRNETKARHEYDLGRINRLENNLADSYEEQQRLFTVISSLGKTIQNIQRVLRNRGRNFNTLQAEAVNTQTTLTDY